MRLDADEIVRVLQQEISQYGQQVESREVGEVLEVGDGIARVYGLAGVMAGEMVEFTRTKVRGLAFNLEPMLAESVDPTVLGGLRVQVGDQVIDATVRTRLESLKNQLLARSSYALRR